MPDPDTTLHQPDMLQAIFQMQAALNDHVFDRQGLRTAAEEPLRMRDIADAAARGELMVNDLPNQWLARYAKAMEEEVKELQADLRWKWWSRDQIDLQNIRVELIDVLHFLVSAMITAGMTAEKVYDVYCQKHAVNLARQAQGYSLESKSEDDNRVIS